MDVAIAAYNTKIAREIESKIKQDMAEGTAFRFTPQQELICERVGRGIGSVIVNAKAGTGKTTLLRGIMQTLQYPRYRVGTFHSHGWSTVRFALKSTRIEGTGRGGAGYDKSDRIINELQVPKYLQSFVAKAADLAMQRGFGVLQPIGEKARWLKMIEHFNISIFDESEDDEDYSHAEEATNQGIDYAIKFIERSVKLAPEVCSFTDMLYLPLAMRMRIFKNDVVMVDECQDTNPIRRALAVQMLKAGGRIIAVGDPKQAIYGFTGADNDAMEQIKEKFQCEEYPLTVTFRCAKSIVREAQQLVPEYEAHPNNEEGIVRRISHKDFLEKEELVPRQDVVLCRNTKPLVEAAYALIRKRIPCHVEGKDIGKGLIKLAAKFKKAKTLSDLSDQLENYREIETANLMAKKKEKQADALNDRIDTLQVIIGTLDPAAPPSALRTAVEAIFDDTPSGEKPRRVVLMTGHRSKGLEFPRVFILGRRAYIPSKYAVQPWQIEQEYNVEYVMLTRAEHELVDVEM